MCPKRLWTRILPSTTNLRWRRILNAPVPVEARISPSVHACPPPRRRRAAVGALERERRHVAAGVERGNLRDGVQSAGSEGHRGREDRSRAAFAGDREGPAARVGAVEAGEHREGPPPGGWTSTIEVGPLVARRS